MKFDNIEQMVLKNLPIKQDQKQVLQRRINKLKRDPRGFIEASYAKRKDQARKYLPIKHDAKHSYTVVSAVYNVEKYLDEYFGSLINQSIDFKKYIQLILVDDGSTDNSAAIIKKWQKKYPKNIHYHHKENGGQASARNLGLQYVKTEWVAFIDPDDFVDVDYFKNADEVLASDSSIKMLAANTLFYIESKQVFKDTHPLRFRFHKKDKKHAINNLKDNINLSAAATIFDYDIIKNNALQFDHKVKPNFEDGKFIGEYLLKAHQHAAWFADNVVYNYRKRDDGSSTLDGSWYSKEKFSNVLEFGFLPLMSNYQMRLGYVPENIQITAMYDMYWYLVHLLNQSEKIDFLSDDEKTRYYDLYRQVMERIDSKTIMSFGIAGAWFFHKVGFLGAFKGEKPPFQICYIESIDKVNQQILISYFDYFDVPVAYRLDGTDTPPSYQKSVYNEFNGELFVSEKRAWIAYENGKQQLEIEIDGKPARLALGGLKHQLKYTIGDIEQFFSSNKYSSTGSWLLMDRETKADDNAEHLYRYIQQQHPEQPIHFALNRDSADWDRLAAEGFNLVAFGELDFELALSNCSKIISSHIEAHIHNYFGDLYQGTKQFVFLQHGVTKDDLSRWLNGKRHVARFITTTKDEYRSIVEGKRYKFTEKEVVLTGFSRHDALYQKNQAAKIYKEAKTILIMPTWRSYLMGETIGKGANERALNPELLNSTYATHWLSLLHSQQLKDLAQLHGYQVVFAPHANIEPYLEQMKLPDYLKIWSASTANNSMQDLFVDADLMITDYSSVAFEMAYIGKPTLYYQFDKDEFFSGSHSYQKGYFDYETHGFGPVSYDEASLLNALESVLAQGVSAQYNERIHQTFEYQDDGNCARIYEAICALDMPQAVPDDGVVRKQMLENVYEHRAWDLVAERAQKLLQIDMGDEYYQQVFLESLIALKQWKQVEIFAIEHNLPIATGQQLKIAFYNEDWQSVGDVFEQINNPTSEEIYLQLQALVKLGNMPAVADFAALWLNDDLLDTDERLALGLWVSHAQADYTDIVAQSEKVAQLPTEILRSLKLQLLLAAAYRQLGEYDLAHEQLVSFEKHTAADRDCRLEIVELAFARGNFGKCVNQFERLLEDGYKPNNERFACYLEAVWQLQDYVKYISIFDRKEQSEMGQMDDRLKVWYIKSLSNIQNWDGVLEEANRLAVNDNADLAYELTLARYRLGRIDEAYQHHVQPNHTHCYEYWALIAEIAFLMSDCELEKYCYRGMIAIYPDRDKDRIMDKLSQLLLY